ncbi:IclR family transcriptional regulator [Achromobacter sp. Marseille-Q4962]|uniref:IclR family transcriptional regulator n=1 Tax=Achromobacter sp. Marseille-Q4962 TaxID=2942202 RepID=UPI002073A6F5|nr:IclR family transcriptional regulator [Achromobacter sp. Marseille-Q4962]
MKDESSAALRALSLLEQVARSPNPVSLAALTEATGLPKPSVLRILSRLVDAGMLLREPAGKSYVSGPRLCAMARDTLLNSPLRAERHRILDSLVDAIGETCNCTMLDGDEVIYLDRVETAWPLRVNLQSGSRVPLHCTASGKLFLAHMRREARQRVLRAAELPRYTPNTVCDPDALEEELRVIRKEGASFDREEFLLGIVCMAAPIMQGNRVVAAVALHAPVARLTIDAARAWLPRMQQAATALARTYEPPAPPPAG